MTQTTDELRHQEAQSQIRIREDPKSTVLQTVTNYSRTHVQRKLPTSSRAPLRKETLHSVETWESKREIIRELYMDQSKPLREVSRILDTEHKFVAR